MPKVSVIIPVYNTEKYLRKCLDSVLNQTLSDIEIICIDDCSTDGSLAVLKEYAASDSRIKIIEFKENKGAGAARNAGIKTATGEYIGFVDSDDYININFYSHLYNSIKDTNVEVAKGKLVIQDVVYSPIKDAFYDINSDVIQNSAYFYHSFTTGLYKRELIKTNNIHFLENCSYFEDPYFSILVTLHCKKVNVVNNAFYYYVERKNSACDNDYINKFPHEKKAILELADILNKANIVKEHYIIAYGYLLRHSVSVREIMIHSEEAVEYLDLLNFLYGNCKYKKEQIDFYFQDTGKIKKRIETKERLFELRNNTKKEVANA